MKKSLLSICFCLLLVSCGNPTALGELTVNEGVIVNNTVPQYEDLVGERAPTDLWLPAQATTFGQFELKLWRGECSGMGRAYHCPGGLDFVTKDDLARVVHRYETPHAATGYHIIDQYIYLFWTHSDSLGAMALGGTTIVVLEINDQAVPTEYASYLVHGGRVGSVRQSDDLLFLDTFKGVEIVDISDPLQPMFRSLFILYEQGERDYGFIHELLPAGSMLYVDWQLGKPCAMYVGTECERHLVALDISDIDTPDLVQIIKIPEKTGPTIGLKMAVYDGLVLFPLAVNESGTATWTAYSVLSRG